VRAHAKAALDVIPDVDNHPLAWGEGEGEGRPLVRRIQFEVLERRKERGRFSSEQENKTYIRKTYRDVALV